MIMVPPPGDQPDLRGDAARMQLHEQSRFRAAAGQARRLYPGPLGELVHRELTAYAEFGYWFDRNGLLARLAAELLATGTESAA